MSDSPEAIRERIHAEELSKGSDPRVAEARAKAAEMRARHGLPIDPEEAWRAKLAQEGGAPSAREAPASTSEAADEAAPEPAAVQTGTPPETTAEERAPTVAAPPASGDAPTTDEPAPASGPPSTEAPSEPDSARVPAAPPAAAVVQEVPFDPEIGDLIKVPVTVSEIGGVKVRDDRLPSWLMAILLAIPLWAILYLLAMGGDDVARRTSDCRINPDRTFVCFQPEEESTSSGGGH